MFSIYGISGQMFSGTLEAMDRVHSLAHARRARAIAQDGDELGIEAGIEAVTPRPQEAAISAYRAVLHGDLERGPLYHAAQVMSRPVVTVAADDSAAHAWRRLRDVMTSPVVAAARVTDIRRIATVQYSTASGTDCLRRR